MTRSIPRKQIPAGAVALAVLATLAAGPSPSRADCHPPSDAIPGGAVSGGSYDTVYPVRSCANAGNLQNTYDGLKIECDDWEGFGTTDMGDTCLVDCSSSQQFTRLLNAAQIIREVQNHAVLFGQHRPISDPDDDFTNNELDANGRFKGAWWDFTVNNEPDEWEQSCENDNANATNYTGVDDYIALHLPGAYKQTALRRAGTVVHENTHEDVGHLDDDECSAGGSCETRYGEYNSTTMASDFLYDAISTYKLVTFNGQPVHKAAVSNTASGRKCKFDPHFSDNERTSALNGINTWRMGRFVDPPVGSPEFYADLGDVDDKYQAKWDCDDCKTSAYTFTPGSCSQPPAACNETLNPANASRNQARRTACTTYNSDIAAGSFSQEAIAAAKTKQNAALVNNPCLSATEAAAQAYCNAEKASAANVNQIDECNWLDNVYAGDVSEASCVQQYCKEKFAQTNGAGWGPNTDPFGCLNWICNEESNDCAADLDTAACKSMVVKAHADPDFYLGGCDNGKCQGEAIKCLFTLLESDPNVWTYPDPIPEQCNTIKQICELASKLAAEVLINTIPWTDPGPLHDVIVSQFVSNSPARSLGMYADEVRRAGAAGRPDAEIAKMVRHLAQSPELIASMYGVSPGHFVALFGNEGLEYVLGPGVRRTPAKRITMQDLNAQGRAALVELERLIATTPNVTSMFGTVKSQQSQ